MRKAKAIRSSHRPFEKGKELLADGYQEFLARKDFTDALRFEMLRSLVVQRLYELNCHDDWICAAKVDEEIETAKKERRRFFSNAGISQFVKEHSIDREMTGKLISLGRKVNTYTRFLGSVRQYVPGVGYAVSIKKRYGPNQDSFLLQEGMLGVADGSGSEKFSAMASNAVLFMLSQKEEELKKYPATTILSVNRELTELMSAGKRLSMITGQLLGSTTVTVAVLNGKRKTIYTVGDSLAFMKLEDRSDTTVVEQLGGMISPRWVMGRPYKNEYKPVEYYDRVGGPVILTTDGITQRIKRTNLALERLFRNIKDNVVLAERLIRFAIRNSLRAGMSDDMTVVIQE